MLHLTLAELGHLLAESELLVITRSDRLRFYHGNK